MARVSQKQKTQKTAIEQNLSRRERQVMDLLFKLERATARELQSALPDPPSYSAVRALLGILEKKGFVKTDGMQSRSYIYTPVTEPAQAKRSALKSLLSTFFEGRPENLVASLLDPKDQKLSRAEIEKIKNLLENE